MVAAGLWTTASDLARFAIGVQEALSGASNPVISRSMTRQMLTDQKSGDGLGLFVQGNGKSRRFTHDGRDDCFDSTLMAYAETGQGAVIMVNANIDRTFILRLLSTIARQYNWLDYPVPVSYPRAPRTSTQCQSARVRLRHRTRSPGERDQPA